MSSAQQPAGRPPPGVESQLGHAPNPLRARGTAALAVILLFPSLLVPMRLYVRLFITKTFRITDAACVSGYVLFVVVMGLGFSFFDYGMGLDTWNITVQDFQRVSELLNIQQAVYMMAMMFTKVAVLLQFLEIFIPRPLRPRNRRAYAIYTLIALNVVFFTIALFVKIFQCYPRKKIWNPKVKGHCLNYPAILLSVGSVNVVDDLLILTMPVLWTWELQMRRARKIGVLCIFATGIFACFTSIMRLVESVKSTRHRHSPVVSVEMFWVSLWAPAELSAGLVVCCLPLVPRLFKHREHTTQDSSPSSHELNKFDSLKGGVDSHAAPASTYSEEFKPSGRVSEARSASNEQQATSYLD